MKKRIAALLALFLLMQPCCGLAGYVAHEGLYNSKNLLEIPDEGVGFYIFPLDTFTFVTPETLEENMELCLSRGGTKEGIRMRMNTGNVLWEGYSDVYPLGRWRLEVYEDDYTRSVWDFKDLLANQIRRVGEDLDQGAWLWEQYDFFNSKKKNYYERQSIFGSFNAYPPYEYESGLYSLTFFNGKAYLLLYAQSTPASSSKLINRNADVPDKDPNQRCNYHTIGWIENPGNDANHYDRGVFVRLGEAKNPPADLRRDDTRAIFNLNSGAYEYTGFTESNARVMIAANGEEIKAKVDNEKKTFKATVQLQNGENEILLTAEKKNLETNTITDILTVNDEMAMLVLTEYLYGDEDRDRLQISGVTSPGAVVTIQLNEEEAVRAEVKKDGKFSYRIEAEEFKEHTVTVTASQEGKEDCTVRTPFRVTYRDEEKRKKAYQKLLNKELDWVDAFENPAEYVGEKISLLVRTEKQEYTDGQVIVEGINVGAHSRPTEKLKCYLVFPSYVRDFLGLSHNVKVMGEIIEPAHMEDGDYFRMQVEVASYYEN